MLKTRRNDRFHGQPALPATMAAVCAAVALVVWPTQRDDAAMAMTEPALQTMPADPSRPDAASVFAGRMDLTEEAAPTF